MLKNNQAGSSASAPNWWGITDPVFLLPFSSIETSCYRYYIMAVKYDKSGFGRLKINV